MSLRCEHHKVRTPLMFSFYDFVDHIALSHNGVIRPSGPVRGINHRCRSPRPDVNQPNFSHDTIKAPCQK